MSSSESAQQAPLVASVAQGLCPHLALPLRDFSCPSCHPAAATALSDYLRRVVDGHRRGDGGVHDHRYDHAHSHRPAHRPRRPQTVFALRHRLFYRRQVGLSVGAVDFAHAAVSRVAWSRLVRLHHRGLDHQRRHRATSAARRTDGLRRHGQQPRFRVGTGAGFRAVSSLRLFRRVSSAPAHY